MSGKLISLCSGIVVATIGGRRAARGRRYNLRLGEKRGNISTEEVEEGFYPVGERSAGGLRSENGCADRGWTRAAAKESPDLKGKKGEQDGLKKNGEVFPSFARKGAYSAQRDDCGKSFRATSLWSAVEGKDRASAEEG